MNDEMSFLIDDDLFEAGREGYAKRESGKSNVWKLKAARPRKGYFLNNPDVKTDWARYREVNAFEGLVGGAELPEGLRQFPVYDQIVVRDPETGVKKRVDKRSNDPVLGLVRPGKFATTGREEPVDTVAVNFVDMMKYPDSDEVSYKHIVLKMSATAAKSLLAVWHTQQALNDDEFDMTAFPWTLTLTGGGKNTKLTPTPHRREGPIDLDEFEAIDIPQMLLDTRKAVERFVEELEKSGNTRLAEQQSADSNGSGLIEDEDEDDEEDLEKADKYSALTNERLKKLLKAAGAEVPPKANRPTLISLAVSNLD